MKINKMNENQLEPMVMILVRISCLEETALHKNCR